MQGNHARTWPYIVAGVVFAGIIGWISYTDALFVTRLAGNTGGIAYAYPVIPDGLLFFSLLSAWEAARAGVPRSRWAVAGLVLGAGMTLAANVGAGLVHSVLDAIIDGLVPVCFFIAVEIVLWHVKRGRVPPRPPEHPAASPVTVPSSSVEAAAARMREAKDRGFRYSNNEAADEFNLKRAEAAKARTLAASAPAPAGGTPRSPAGAPIPSSNGHRA